ncbi:MAG: VOC family protein [Myxococcales bacterium]|nr:VOC family protein [Myxococcales bacterium]
MTQTRIHVSLRTADLEATTAFYTKLFGAGPDKVRDGYVRFAPDDVPILLSVMPGEPAVDHFGLRVGESQEAQMAWQRIQADGISLTPKEDVVCCHALKDEAWLSDPDGRSWEVYAVTDEAPEGAVDDPACCPDAQPSAGGGCCG